MKAIQQLLKFSCAIEMQTTRMLSETMEKGREKREW
jgi:hypothetical protein